MLPTQTQNKSKLNKPIINTYTYIHTHTHTKQKTKTKSEEPKLEPLS